MNIGSPKVGQLFAAGNRDSDRAATTRMPTPMGSRFVHIDFEVDVPEWSEWAIQTAIWPEVIAFIPNIDAILLNPNQKPVPENAAAQYAVASALARRTSDGNTDRICQYLKRMPTEFNVLCVRDASLYSPAIRSIAAYTKWAVENHHVLA